MSQFLYLPSFIFYRKSAYLPVWLILFLAAFFAQGHYSAYAASSIDILDRQRSQMQQAPRSQPKIIITEEGKISGIGDDTQFTLGSLEIGGSTVFSEKELLAPWQSLIGKKISFAQLNSVTSALTKKYRDAGYLLSRVIIPEQEVDQDNANIHLLVVEGFIESIEYTGDKRVLERFKSYFAPDARKLVGHKPLKHSQFERYMLLMNDAPGINISSTFRRGNIPGGSILMLDVQGDLFDGNISWGNIGTKESGPAIGTVSGGVNTLPAIGSNLTLSYSQADDYMEYWMIQIAGSYQLWNGLNFNASYGYSDSPRQDSDFAKLFDYTTHSHTFNGGFSYPFIRSRDLNLSAGINYEQRESETDLLEERFSKEKLRTLSASINFDFSDSLGGVTQIIPGVYRGLNFADATDEASDATNPQAPADFWKFTIYASRDQQLPYNFSFFTAGKAQFANASLAEYNQIDFGGSNFGRGYYPGVIEGDNGVAVTAEPRWTQYLTDTLALQLYSFIDWGSMWTSKSIPGKKDWETASSYGGGIRLWGHVGDKMVPDFNINAFVGVPMESAGDEEVGDTRFVLQVAIHF